MCKFAWCVVSVTRKLLRIDHFSKAQRSGAMQSGHNHNMHSHVSVVHSFPPTARWSALKPHPWGSDVTEHCLTLLQHLCIRAAAAATTCM